MKGEEEDTSAKPRLSKSSAIDKRAMLQQFSSNQRSDVAKFKSVLKEQPKAEAPAPVPAEKPVKKSVKLSDVRPLNNAPPLPTAGCENQVPEKGKMSLKTLQEKKSKLPPSLEPADDQPRNLPGGSPNIDRAIELTEDELKRSDNTLLGLSIHYITVFGQILAISGSIKEFGEWDIKHARKLTYCKGANVNWKLEISLPSNVYFEYKYLLLDDTGSVIKWEPRVNRELQLMGTKGFRLIDQWGVENLEEEITRNEEAKRRQFENELARIEEEQEETRKRREEKRIEKEKMRQKMEDESRKHGVEQEEARRMADEEMKEKERAEKQKMLEEEALKREEERTRALEEQKVKEEERKRQLEEEQKKMEEERHRAREERKKREEERRKKREEEELLKQKEEEEFQKQRAERLAARSKRAEDSFTSLSSRVPSHYSAATPSTTPTPSSSSSSSSTSTSTSSTKPTATATTTAPVPTPAPAPAAPTPAEDDDPVARRREEMRRAREAKLAAEAEEERREEEARKKREEERKKRLNDRRANRQNQAAQEEQEREAKKKEEDAKRLEEERLLREQEKKREEFEAKVQKHRAEHEKVVSLYQDSRVVKDTPFPNSIKFGLDILFDQDNKIRDHALKEHFINEGRVTIECATEIVKRATALLKAEPNVVELKAPVVICGDIHGQFYDLTTKLMDLAGGPDYVPYLFLGDYVDRGNFATEVVLYLFALKIQFPQAVVLLRGNHECRSITMHYNFKSEVLYKYNLELYDLLMESFDALPLAATVDSAQGKFFCIHAGIGPGIKTIDDIQKLDRFQEIPERGPLCDIVWSDPVDENVAVSEKELGDWYLMNFKPNSTRGCSYIYGNTAVSRFLETNNLKAIVRGHEVQKYGYLEHMFKRSDIDNPLVITIFSAPNYCDKYENLGAFLKVYDNEYQFNQMTWTEHPYVLPQYLDAFTFTLPFIAENVAKVLLNALRFCIDTLEETDEDSAALKTVREKFRAKNKGMNKLMALLKLQRANNEDMIRPFASKYQYNLSMFERAVQEDHNNELRPIFDARKLSKNKSTPAFRQVEMKTRRPVVNQRQATFAFSSKAAAKFDFI